ncbi:hypothetical protein [Nonomuraea dietziae]|uniref:hypothetical protein n=1 Tax=Nonomuraea dietziae TaxID=65515 RepID=UPI003410A354
MTRTLLVLALLTGGLSGHEVTGACTGDVVVGDPFDGPGAVHRLSGGALVPVEAPELGEGDAFGWSVAMAEVDGDGCGDLLVGAPYADVEGRKDAGAAYLLTSKGATVRLTAPEPQQDAHFGWTVAAKGDLVAVAAPYEDLAEVKDAGSVYVRRGEAPLRRIGQDTPDVPGNPEVGDQYGWALAFGAGNSLVVGVPYENDDGTGVQVEEGKIDSGSMTVLADVTAQRLSGTKWEPPDRATGDRFGYAVAYAEGSGIAVGAPQAGFVQLFDEAVAPTRKVTGEGAFGFSLAAAKDGRLAVGAPYAGSTGAVRVLSMADESVDRLLVPGQGARFGWSVAFAGNQLVAGAPDDQPYGTAGVAGRNADTIEAVKPPEGAEFGASMAS